MPPRGGASSVLLLAFDPAEFSLLLPRLFPGPTELGAVHPDNGMDRPCSNRVNGNAAEAQLIREKERAMTDIAMHNDRIATIGMDLGKHCFHLIGMDARGKVIMRQKQCRAGDLSGTWPTSSRVWWGSKPAPEHTASVADSRPLVITFD